MNHANKNIEKLDVYGYSLNRIRYESNASISLYMSAPPDASGKYRGYELQFLRVLGCIVNFTIEPWLGSIVSCQLTEMSRELMKALSGREVHQDLGDYTVFSVSTDKGKIEIAARDYAFLETKEILRY